MKKLSSYLFTMLAVNMGWSQTNTTLGTNAGGSITTAVYGTTIGYNAGQDLSTGNFSTFIGANAGANTTTGAQNTFIGSSSGYQNTIGQYNTAIGDYSGYASTGSNNVYLGKHAGYQNTKDGNVFVGYFSGYSNTTGSANLFAGYMTGYYSTGSSNTFLGYYAGYKNTSGSTNTFVGSYTGFDNTTGHNNVFLGQTAGRLNTTGAYNVCIGNFSGYKNTTGIKNVYIGQTAGYNNVSGNNNVFIGNQAGHGETGSDKFYLANSSTNTLLYGDFATTKLGIGTTTPTETLDVNGTIAIRGGSPAAGYVLTSDANGVASWQAPTGGAGGGVWSVNGSDVYYNAGNVGVGMIPSAYLDGAPIAPLEVSSFMHISRTSRPHVRLFENGNTVARMQGGHYTGMGNGAPGGNPHFVLTDPQGSTTILSANLTSKNVGIGTVNAQQRLHVYNTSGNAMMRFQTANRAWDVGMVTNGGNPDEFVIADETGNKWFLINTSNKTVVMGVPNQNHHSLAVQGKMTAQEIKVKPDPLVPDYVFEEDYTLKGLDEVEAYVKEHKHLPGIPSAQEIEENEGVYLGEMTYKLLEKVEELTLHMIKLKKENEELKARLETLETK
ncbi:hypothetical protein JMN32_06720 [Fulvivirga sp. 29W222]|uniref:Peptidase S74 domain-containing protein n=1 Tax=Fulvivirga marina TaxID=2494733 RepID=A0A937FU52_9BACT|nr:hypothetical protein [Fulvivirga marina]MBL6445994.1 hypothetical protein [Fulvivirga marina]